MPACLDVMIAGNVLIADVKIVSGRWAFAEAWQGSGR